MKKITQLLVLALIISATTFATNIHDNVNKNIQAAFNEKFVDAKEVSWASKDSYVMASFQKDGQFVAAYFTGNGDLMGITRNLISHQLPINLQKSLKKELTGGWITELFEYATDEETTYYATLENVDQKVVLKSIDSHNWIIIKKSKKN
ncbi:MAG: hypothetical protein ABIN89_16785 [Chitinophagaceae bacterium]